MTGQLNKNGGRMYAMFFLVIGAGCLVALAAREYFKQEVEPRRDYHRSLRKIGRSSAVQTESAAEKEG
jgi:hypothetical protein